MKKLQAFLVKRSQAFFAILAVVMGIGSALAFTPKHDDPCASATLYYFNGSTYVQITTSGSCNIFFPDHSCKYYQSSPGVFTGCDPSLYGAGRFVPTSH